jgi:plastocyanin
VIGLASSVATVALASALAVQSLTGIPGTSAQVSPGAPAGGSPAQPPVPTGSPVITVEAGAFDPSTQAEVQEFLPRTVRVPVGGAIRWRIKGFHNVAFPSGTQAPELIQPLPGAPDVQVNPLIAFPVQPSPTYDGTAYFNSGLPQPNQQDFEWTLTFAKPGAYAYLCSVHPNMQAYVVVEPPGTAVPTQDEVTAQGQREAQQYIADAQTALQRQQAAVPAAATGGTWTVSMDAPDSTHYALQRFFPQAITIQAGDTIRWVNPALTEPHTVTFRAGAPRESEFLPTPQPNGPPLIMGNMRVLAPVTPPAPYDGQSYANSGFLGEGFPFGREFRLTFAQPGTYQYVCVLHEDLGMSGFVVVAPRS